MMQNRRFVDTLAVKSKSDADYKIHVAKRKQRNKDLEIVFDPESHRSVHVLLYWFVCMEGLRRSGQRVRDA